MFNVNNYLHSTLQIVPIGNITVTRDSFSPCVVLVLKLVIMGSSVACCFFNYQFPLKF